MEELSSVPAPGSSPGARDISGVIAPPPLIFLAGLAVGFGVQALLPETSLPGALRWVLGGALLLAGLALLFSFERAGLPPEGDGSQSVAPDDCYRHRRAVPAHPQPRVRGDGPGVHRDRGACRGTLGAAAAAARASDHRPRGDRPRGALPRAQVRAGVPGLQGRRQALALISHQAPLSLPRPPSPG